MIPQTPSGAGKPVDSFGCLWATWGGAFRKRTSGLLRVMAGHPWDSKMAVQAFTSVCSRGEQWLRANSSLICASPLTSRTAVDLVSAA